MRPDAWSAAVYSGNLTTRNLSVRSHAQNEIAPYCCSAYARTCGRGILGNACHRPQNPIARCTSCARKYSGHIVVANYADDEAYERKDPAAFWQRMFDKKLVDELRDADGKVVAHRESAMGDLLEGLAQAPAKPNVKGRGDNTHRYATWVNFKNRQDLEVLTQGDPASFNPYGSILVRM
jgi:hypothetical protein